MNARPVIGALALLAASCGRAQSAPAAGNAPDPAARLVLDAGVKSIVYATRELHPDGHWYANFGYYAAEGEEPVYREGGRLLRLDLASGQTTLLVDDPKGTVRDPAVHYDGHTIVFSWRKSGTKHFHLYEIQSDGTGLRQITQGDANDLEPCWLPDDRLVFVSDRSWRWVNCWLTHVTTMYRCRRDGSDLHPISYNTEHDNTPWVLNDGRLVFMRWEYVDRSQVHYHHLWTCNPDGTANTVFYGNQTPGDVHIDARPIPGRREVLMIRSPGHGANDHQGLVALVDPTGGPDRPGAVRDVTRQGGFRDPYPVTPHLFLAAQGRAIVVMNPQGEVRPLVRLPDAYGSTVLAHEPRPLVARPREPVIPDRISRTAATGRFVLSDIYAGRNMAGVKRGEIKSLLVLEVLPKPINYTGGMEPLSLGGTFTLERIMGTVPVEADGSAHFELPAGRSFFFVALDARERSVKRMQSFTGVMPGEVTGCIGCHEPRTQAPPEVLAAAPGARKPPVSLALRKAAVAPTPIPDTPDVFDFPRDIQPILNRLCLDCHDYTPTARGGPRAGGVILTGDRGPMFSHSYVSLTLRKLFSDGRNDPKSNYPPRALGSSASRILDMVEGGHHDVRATERERRFLRLWIESAAPYPGTYAALGSGMIGGHYRNKQEINVDYEWPTTRAAQPVFRERCASCHQGDRHLAAAISHHARQPRFDSHAIYNLTRPEYSMVLLAPLAVSAGGYGLCRAEGQPAGSGKVIESRDDPAYRTLRAMVEAGRDKLNDVTRFDMPDFKPRPAYLREMKRYGVLPEHFDVFNAPPVNVYELDRAYWKKLWWSPEAAAPSPAITH